MILKVISDLLAIVDHTVDTSDLHMVAWQILGNSDPIVIMTFTSAASVFLDGTVKAFRKGGFPRKWPNVVCSDNRNNFRLLISKWDSLGLGEFISSPSRKYHLLLRNGSDEIIRSG